MTKLNTRTGKIARLPHEIRAELNHRLQDGEQGKSLIQWLNPHPLVQETLDDLFAGRAINHQNLTEWKQGGYLDSLLQDESRALIQILAEHDKDFNNLADGADITDRFAHSGNKGDMAEACGGGAQGDKAAALPHQINSALTMSDPSGPAPPGPAAPTPIQTHSK